MELQTLVHLLEDSQTWVKTNFYKEELKKENTDIVHEILSHINTIVNGKTMLPFARLGAVKLLKDCLEAGQDYFNFMVQEGDFLDKLAEYTKAKPASQIFSLKPDKREQEISFTFYTYILEGFLVWSTWFPDTKFSQLYQMLKKQGVVFPEKTKLQIFKKKSLNQYINGVFQKKGKSTTPGATTSGLKLEISDQEVEEQVMKYDTMKELMLEMMQMDNGEAGADDFVMFSDSMNAFSKFTDTVFKNGEPQNVSHQHQELLLDRSEQCLEISMLIEKFYTQQISFSQLRQALLQLHNQNSGQNPEANFQQISNEEQLRREERRQEVEDQQRRLLEKQEDDMRRSQQQKEEQNRIMQFQLQQEEEFRRKKEQQEQEEHQQQLKEEEENIKRQNELVQMNLQKERKELEQKLIKLEQQEKEKKIAEQQNKKQKELEEQDRKQKEFDDISKKHQDQEMEQRRQRSLLDQQQRQALKDEKDHNLRVLEEQQRNHKIQEQQKEGQLQRNNRQDTFEDEEIEERKSEKQQKKGNSALKENFGGNQFPQTNKQVISSGQQQFQNYFGTKPGQNMREEMELFEEDQDIDNQYHISTQQAAPLNNQKSDVRFDPFSGSNNQNPRLTESLVRNNQQQQNQFQEHQAPKQPNKYFGEEEFYDEEVVNKNLQFQKQVSESSIKKGQKLNSKLEMSGNIEEERISSGIQHLNSTIALRPKIDQEQQKILANPKNVFTPQQVSQQNKLENSLFQGFEQISFQQPSTLRTTLQNQQENANKISNNSQEQGLSKSRLREALSENNLQGIPRSPEKVTFTSEYKRVPIFTKDRQNSVEINNLRTTIAEQRRESDLEVTRLKALNSQLQKNFRDKEEVMSQKGQEGGQYMRQVEQENNELENRMIEKDKIIFQQKKLLEQQAREIDSSKQIVRQYESQKQEQHFLLSDKKKAMEAENQKTKDQLKEYINSTQKSQNARLEELQKSLTQAQLDSQNYQAELQHREMEIADLRNDLSILKGKENSFSQAYMKEKDLKIAEMRSKIDVLNSQTSALVQRISDFDGLQSSLRKEIEHLKEEISAYESQGAILKESIVQKDIEISRAKQLGFEKDQSLYQKQQEIIALETSLSKKKQIIDQFKGSSENQIKKFNEIIEEQDVLIKDLQQQKRGLEDRIENLSSQHQADIIRIVEASQMSEEEKRLYKTMIAENGKLKQSTQGSVLREQNLLSQVSQLTKQLEHLKKEYALQEHNLEDMVTTNNLLSKKLYDRDEQFQKEQELKERDLELKERKLGTELKYTRQAMETLKLDNQRKETDLQRGINTLRKENELLTNNLKTRNFISQDLSSNRSQTSFPFQQINEIDKSAADRLIQDSERIYQESMKAKIQYISPTPQFQRNVNEFHSLGLDEERSYNSSNNVSINGGKFNASQNQPKWPLSKPKTLGKVHRYNPTYFSYLTADLNQMYKFKKSCLKNKMAVYSDNLLNVGITTEAKDVDGKTLLLINLFFENKSYNYPLENLSISYEGDQSVNVFKKPTQLQNVLREGQQQQQQILTEFLEIPYKIIQCRIQYSVQGKLNQALFPLPNTINKYFSTQVIANPSEINDAFTQLSHLIESSEEIVVDKNIASSQYDYQNFFPSFSNLGNSEGIPNFQCIGGRFSLKNIDSNIYIRVHYNKKDHKAIFQVVHNNILEEYAVNATRYFLQTLMMIFKQ